MEWPKPTAVQVLYGQSIEGGHMAKTYVQWGLRLDPDLDRRARAAAERAGEGPYEYALNAIRARVQLDKMAARARERAWRLVTGRAERLVMWEGFPGAIEEEARQG